MADEFSETDEWPVPQGWMRHQAETGLVPPPRSTLRPNDDRTVWRDRGARIAALETENTELRDALADLASNLSRVPGAKEDVIYGVPCTTGPDPIIMTTYDGTARKFTRWTLRTPWTEAPKEPTVQEVAAKHVGGGS